MKVLQINAVYGVGSTGIIVEDIHKLSLSKGIESFVAYSTSPYLQSDIANGCILLQIYAPIIHKLLRIKQGISTCL